MIKKLVLTATLAALMAPVSVGASTAPASRFEAVQTPVSNDECWLRAGCAYLGDGVWICPSPDTYQECKVPDH